MNFTQKEVNFSYKTRKDQATGMEEKRPTEVLAINFPAVADLVKETSEKGLALIQEAVEAIMIGRARELLENCSSANFPYDQLDWEVIANLPPAQRRGGGISKEQWDAFLADYCTVMPGITGKSQDQIDNASAILGKRLSTVKNSKDHLAFFEKQLGMYITGAPNAAEYTDVLEFLTSKVDEYKSLTADDVLKNL